MPIVWFTAECINIVSSRLPLVCVYSQAIATDRAVTPIPRSGRTVRTCQHPEERRGAGANNPRSVPAGHLHVRIQSGPPDAEAHSRAIQFLHPPVRGSTGRLQSR